MKFVKNFKVAVEHQDVTQIGTIEDMYMAAEILKRAGTPWESFENSTKALEACKHLVSKNAEEHGHEVKADIDNKFPQYSKFWMCYGKGKETTGKQITSKKLAQDAGLNNLQQLEFAKSAMELIGWQEPSQSSGTQPQIENALAGELKKLSEIMKLC